MAASDDQVRTGVEAYVRLVGEGTAEEVVALFADGATVEDPVGSQALSTRAQLVTTVGDATYTVRPVDVMTFDDDGRITSMRAFWGADDMVAG